MVEISSLPSIERNSIDTLNLNNQQFRLNKISEIENYFITEIKERELMSKRLLIILIGLQLFYQQQVVAFLLHHLQQLLEHLYE